MDNLLVSVFSILVIILLILSIFSLTYFPRLYLYKKFYKKLNIKPTNILRERYVASFFNLYIFLYIAIVFIINTLDVITYGIGNEISIAIFIVVGVNLIIPILLARMHDVPLHRSIPNEFFINVISFICFMLTGVFGNLVLILWYKFDNS